MTRPPCERCGEPKTKLKRQVVSSGSFQIAWYCEKCGRWAQMPPKWIAHDKAVAYLAQWGATILDLPKIADYSNHDCAICGSPAEAHHWAPEALADAFGEEWLFWPITPLCSYHHKLWHNIVTPNLGQEMK